MDVVPVSENLMIAMILFHTALLAVPCVWVSFKVMSEELRAHEISWRLRPASRPAGRFQWA